MSTIPEPSDDDILAALAEEFDEPDVSDVIDVSKLDDLTLSNTLADTRERLLEMGEMMSDLENTYGTEAGSAEARELHSLRLACLTEMSKRGMR